MAKLRDCQQGSEDLYHLSEELGTEVSPRAHLGTGYRSLILTESRNSLSFEAKESVNAEQGQFICTRHQSEHSWWLTAEAA